MRFVVAAAIVALLVLDPGRSHASCHDLYRVATVCDAWAESPQGQANRFASALLTFWNLMDVHKGSPADIARCAPLGVGRDGLMRFACEWRVYWKPVRRYRCIYAVLDTGWNQYSGGWVRCRGVFVPPGAA